MGSGHWTFQSKRYSNQFLHAIKPLVFEILGFYGSVRKKFFPNKDSGEIFLNIGCGSNLIPNFLNVDFYGWRSSKGVFEHDLRENLPFSSNRFEGIVTEHTIEHLYPNGTIKLLSESFRVLKPGGVLRIGVPDLDKYLEFCAGKMPHPQFSRYENGCEAIWHLTQNNLHLSVWNFEMLEKHLMAIGFGEVKKLEFRKGSSGLADHDATNREWESLYVEAYKPTTST